MTAWPDELEVGPIREWPGALTADRRVSPFRQPGKTITVDGKPRYRPAQPMPLSKTVAELGRELDAIDATDAELLVAIDAAQFRRDGKPYANAKAEHPGVILSFEIPGVGAVSYPCDAFTTWEDNLRAVVLALEALRKVDRYGVTRGGEQYRGFLALDSAPKLDTRAAWLVLWHAAGYEVATIPNHSDRVAAEILRKAKRKTHPDTGGNAEAFQRVTEAEQQLREQGEI